MEPSRLQQLQWRARRGMLELDNLFGHYLVTHGAELSNGELDDLERLLYLQDQQLFDAFSGKQQLDDESLQKLLHDIIASHNPDTD